MYVSKNVFWFLSVKYFKKQVAEHFLRDYNVPAENELADKPMLVEIINDLIGKFDKQCKSRSTMRTMLLNQY